MADISFHGEAETLVPFAGLEDQYSQWIANIARQENKTINYITFIFCSDDYLLDINIKYLNHDYYTDIITFPYKEGDDIESDIYISVDRVKENAEDYQESFENELLRVMAHGVLHLMGYGDKNPEMSNIMRAKEDECIQLFMSFNTL
jgi:rRNA maturation RNase YbeY